REYLKKMSVRILEVHASPAVGMIDLAGPALARVRPVRQLQLPDAREDLVELRLADQEGIVLRFDLAGCIDEVQADAVGGGHDEERPEAGGFAEAEEVGEEAGGGLAVASLDDEVVELSGHRRTSCLVADAQVAGPCRGRNQPIT